MKGFTFIELLIYIGIVSVVLILASGFAWDIIRGSVKTTSYREVQQNARFAMENVVRSLRAGDDPGVFTVADGILYQDGVALTADQVEVTKFEIIPIAETYKVSLEIEHSNPEGITGNKAKVSFESTVCTIEEATSSEDCWGIGDLCDSSCMYSDYGPLTDYYIDPGCSDSCSVADSFYTNPSGECSNDGTGDCYQMSATTTQYTSCSQGTGCLSGCGGTCTPCDTFLAQPSCEAQAGCYWQGKKCRGGCQSCDFFITQPSCEAQAGCSWQALGWNWNLTNPVDGSPSYTACEWYAQ